MVEAGDSKPTEDVDFESNAFETLERDFQEVLTELVGDKSLDSFRGEYEKLHRALKKSHESEKRLIKQCRELNGEIVANAAKVQTALKLSDEDQATIASLKAEIEKTWATADGSHQKEARAKETVQQLRAEIQNLSRLVEQGAGLTMGQEAAVNELLAAKEELTAERDAQMARIVEMRTEIGGLIEQAQALDKGRLAAERELSALRELLLVQRADAEREVRRRERLEREVKDTASATDARAQELHAKSDSLAKLSDKLGMLEAQLRTQRAQTEQALKQLEGSRLRHASLAHEVEEKLAHVAALRAEGAQAADELRRRGLEADQARQEIQRRAKERDAALKQNRELQDARTGAQRQRDTLKAAIEAAEREIGAEKAETEAERRAVADIAREREALQAAHERADGATGKQVDLVRLNEVLIAELEEEIAAAKAEGGRQRQALLGLEQQRARHAEEAREVERRFAKVRDEVRLREAAISDVAKRLAECEAKLKAQQKLYESVRTERNAFSKKLVEGQDEIAELRRKHKVMGHQLEQLKEEIQSKETAFIKESFEHGVVQKERAAIKADVERSRGAIAAAEAALGGHRAQMASLNAAINEADARRLRQRREYEAIITERDILGSQLIRRNDELALLYEKLRIQQRLLMDAERLFAARVGDTRLLRLAIGNLTRQLHVSSRQGSNLEAIREETFGLQRALLQERTKARALSEELENTANPHRWRKLGGADPSAFEMVHKIQSLQRRLILKTEEVVENDMLAQEKDELYTELKGTLARQPGPEVAEQLCMQQQLLRDKTRSMKAVASELNMYQAQVNDARYEMERSARELQDVKRQYYEQKRRETLAKERERQALGGELAFAQTRSETMT